MSTTVSIPLASPVVSPTSVHRPLQLVDSVTTSPTSICSPRGSLHGLGLSTPPPSARAFTPSNPRRQSSISYFPSDHVAPHDARLPAKGTPNPRRTQSMGIWAGDNSSGISKVKGDRRSLTSLEPASPRPQVDHGPLTLTEKHADLLQFIAQKESKCLELRSQLAAHESELAQLKRKWERIVSRGMDRAYSTQPSSSTSLLANATHSSGYPGSSVSSLTTTANAAIKEGVRIIANSLELSSPVASHSLSSPVLSPPAVPISGFATVSRASMAVMKANSRHATTMSVSSVSTSTTSSYSSGSAQSQRLSQSSASSLTSSLSLDEAAEEDMTARFNPSPIPEEKSADPAVPVEVSPRHSGKLLRRRSYEAEESPVLPSSPRSETTAKLTGQHKTRKPSVADQQPPAASVTSLMTSVGRKWEEIQRGHTFTKSQKRASLLISDVSQSIFAALASPTQPVASPRSKLQHSTLASPPSLSSSTSASASLLEEDFGAGGLGDVLVPSVLSPTPAAPAPVAQQATIVDDDDDWNW